MKLNIGSGHVTRDSDIEAFTLYDDAAIALARHGVMSKALREARGKGAEGGRSRRARSRDMRRGQASQERHHGR